MIRVIFGNKGIGKTKYLLDYANELSNKTKGTVVYIDSSDQLMCELGHEIRFINTNELNIDKKDKLFGLICGILSSNYDIEYIIIDGIDKFVEKVECINEFFELIKPLEEKYNLKLIVSMNKEVTGIPDYVIKEYTC